MNTNKSTILPIMTVKREDQVTNSKYDSHGRTPLLTLLLHIQCQLILNPVSGGPCSILNVYDYSSSSQFHYSTICYRQSSRYLVIHLARYIIQIETLITMYMHSAYQLYSLFLSFVSNKSISKCVMCCKKEHLINFISALHHEIITQQVAIKHS